jgi:hypothetical protein
MSRVVTARLRVAVLATWRLAAVSAVVALASGVNVVVAAVAVVRWAVVAVVEQQPERGCGNVGANQREARIIKPVPHVVDTAGQHVIDSRDARARQRQQRVDEV